MGPFDSFCVAADGLDKSLSGNVGAVGSCLCGPFLSFLGKSVAYHKDVCWASNRGDDGRCNCLFENSNSIQVPAVERSDRLIALV